jgi:3-dehydrosphinganine reductase
MHAVVTGGSSGIGLALVRRLAGRGDRVSVLALDDADLAALAADPPSAAVRTTPVDVADRAAVRVAIEEAEAAQGSCDLLVTCAGIVTPGRFWELPDEEFVRHIDVNYLGTVWPVRAVVPGMIARGAGTIVMISSFAGLLGVYGYGAYSPSKFAIRGLAETLRMELKPHGVHVAAVYPSDVDTPMLAAENELKPPETFAVSGNAEMQTTDQVVDAILRGVRRRQATILCDRSSALLASLAGTAPWVARAVTDRSVARARANPTQPGG